MRWKVLVTVSLISASSTSAGLLDRFRGPASSISASVASATSSAGVAVPSPAGAPLPQTPAEPSVDDAFGAAAAVPTGRPASAPVGSGNDRTAAVQTGEAQAQTNNPLRLPGVKDRFAEPFDGYQFKWKFLTFRPREFKLEGLCLAGLLSYLAVALGGKNANKNQATSWWKAHIGLLNENFASFMKNPATAQLQRADANTYYGYASGRRGTSGMVVQITTKPRQDLIALAWETGYKLYDLSSSSETGKLLVNIELEHAAEGGRLPAGKEDLIWALVERHRLHEVRERRWDLASFGQLTEPRELSNLPNKHGEHFVVLSENGQLTEMLLKNSKGDTGILQLLGSDDEAAQKAIKWLEYISISDIVAERPDEAVLEKAGRIPQTRRLTLSARLPPASRSAETVPLLELAFNIVDILNSTSLSNDVVSKGRKRRQEVYNLLLAESRKEANDKKISDARAIKKRADEERKEKMSLVERRKLEAKERDKEMRKAALKAQKR